MFNTDILPEEIKLGTVIDDRKLMKLFVFFLKANNCYREYRVNQMCDKYRGHHRNFFYHFSKEEYQNYKQKELAMELINFAFTWSDTKQGHAYWSELSWAWINLLRQYTLRLEHAF